MVIPVQPKHLTTTLRQSRDDARDGSCQIGGLELLLDTRHVTDPLAEGEPPPVGTERVERAVADRAIEIGRDRTGNLPDAPPLPQRDEQLLHDFLRHVARADVSIRTVIEGLRIPPKQLLERARVAGANPRE